MKPKEINREYIKKLVEDVFKNTKPLKSERFLKLMSYCRGIDGARDYGANMESLCDHPECVQCRNF